jgi:hypothetical protein
VAASQKGLWPTAMSVLDAIAGATAAAATESPSRDFAATIFRSFDLKVIPWLRLSWDHPYYYYILKKIRIILCVDMMMFINM